MGALAVMMPAYQFIPRPFNFKKAIIKTMLEIFNSLKDEFYDLLFSGGRSDVGTDRWF